MAARKENFFSSHWDWLVCGAGLLALIGAGVLLAMGLGSSPESASAQFEAGLAATRPAHEGVEEADLSVLQTAYRGAKTPPSLGAVDPTKANFLGSERRVVCQQGDPDVKEKSCGRPIPADAIECPFCHAKQMVVKVEIDLDHDGIPNDWEAKYGLNPNDAADANLDSDGDGFTNLEEYQAGTDPRDAESHPDYLDSLFVSGEMKQKFLPFYFKEANPIPGNTFRLTFLRLDTKSVYDNKFSVKVGEPVKSSDGKIDTGYVAKSYTPKTVQQVIKGSKGGSTRAVDVSTVELVRKDGKTLVARIGDRRIPEEVLADLVYRRGGEKTFTVAVGSEIELNGRKYRVVKLEPSRKSCKVTILDLKTKKEKILQGT